MYKLILMLFIAALMFGCSKEDAEHAGDAVDAAKEHAGDAVDAAKEHAGDAADSVKEHAGDAVDSAKEMMDGDAIKGPEVEPLPDFDSLPPIEEEAAEGGETMMEKAEEVVEKVKEHAGDAAESAKEHAGDAAEKMMKKE
jgi:ElaB/YqjD/DUF883 family membrane-anchored ribosome-binding protein